MKIGIIGMGVMGRAIAVRLGGDIHIVQRRAGTVESSQAERYHCIVHQDALELVRACDLVFIAVKPPHWPALRDELGDDNTGKVLVSIMAGVELAEIERTGAKGARLMPNLAISVGAGVVGCAYSAAWSGTEKHGLRDLCKSFGLFIELREEQLAVLTAISGSGIAYFLEFLRIFAESGERAGLADARAIVAQTAKGAAILLDEQPDDFADLIARVASRGGTTEQGLIAMREAQLVRTISDVVERTIEKSHALGKTYRGGA